jgi:hypothetical protein
MNPKRNRLPYEVGQGFIAETLGPKQVYGKGNEAGNGQEGASGQLP